MANIEVKHTGAAKLISSFDASLPAPSANTARFNAKKETYFKLATQVGYLFEYFTLSKLGGKPAGQAAAAFNLFKNANSRATKSGIFGYLRQGNDVNKYYGQALKVISAQVERAASAAVKEKLKELEKFPETKTYFLDLGSSTKGDIEQVVKDLADEVMKKYVIELKWQMSPDAMVRWFGKVDSGDFTNILKSNPDKYWNFKESPNRWVTLQRKEALTAYLSQAGYSAESKQAVSLLKYLMHKMQSPVAPKQFDKGVIYGGYKGDQIAVFTLDLDELFDILDQVSSTFDRGSTLKFLADQYPGEEIATFGVDYDGIGKDPSKSTRRTQARTNIDEAKFTFEMYISNKLLMSENSLFETL